MYILAVSHVSPSRSSVLSKQVSPLPPQLTYFTVAANIFGDSIRTTAWLGQDLSICGVPLARSFTCTLPIPDQPNITTVLGSTRISLAGLSDFGFYWIIHVLVQYAYAYAEPFLLAYSPPHPDVSDHARIWFDALGPHLSIESRYDSDWSEPSVRHRA